ncbi:MAG: tail fiber domain-containing protein [Bacteroidia bacterium]
MNKLITTLAVISGMLVMQSASVNAQWSLTGNAGTNATTNFIGTTDNVALKFRTKNVNRMTINGTGNVGIGTTSPSSKLDVNGQVTIDQKNFGGYGGLLMKGGNLGIGNYPNIGFSQINAAGTDIVSGFIQGIPTNNATGAESMDLGLYTSQAGVAGLAARVYIKDNGNVGIGTSTPQAKLDVNGNIQISNASIPMGLITEIGGFSPVLNMSVNFREQNKNTAYKGGGFRIDSRAGQPLFQWIYRPAGSSSEFVNMMLDSTGRLGIGTTNPQGKLHVFGGDAYLWGLNLGFGTTNAIISTDSPKPLIFQQAGSEKMRMDANGNLGIGTSTPTAKLQVSGGDALINGLTAGLGGGAVLSNSALGKDALYNNSTGTSNTATGWRALFSNTTGISNTAHGDSALYSNTNGNYNVATGNGALFSNIGSSTLSIYPGSRNTANGYQALYSNNIGYDNTAIGFKALYTNADGIFNCANGWGALYNNTNGYENTAMGHEALYQNTTGDFNTALGAVALDGNYTGLGNTAVGTGADVNSDGYSYSSAFGVNTTITASYQIRLGNNTVTSIGGFAGWTTLPSDKRFKKNIQTNVPGLEFISKLKPVTYTLDVSGINNFLRKDMPVRKDAEGRIIELPKDENGIAAKEKVVYSGFIAQDVETAAKEIDYDFSGVDAPKNDHDVYGLRYAEFVVPIVKAVQELSKQNDDLKKEMQNQSEIKDAKIAEQQKQIDLLAVQMQKFESALSQCCTNFKEASGNEQITIDAARLEQNQPNPFNQTSVIKFYVPSNFRNAQLVITDLSGVTLKSFSINQSGVGQIIINANELAAGSYLYSLIIDNAKVDSKKMELTK